MTSIISPRIGLLSRVFGKYITRMRTPTSSVMPAITSRSDSGKCILAARFFNAVSESPREADRARVLLEDTESALLV